MCYSAVSLIMNKRFVATAFIALAVLFSQGGGSALAALCPHLRSVKKACHETQPQEVTETHHRTERANGHAFDATGTAAPCSHCAVHSRTKRDDSTLQPPNTSQRASDPATSIPESVVGPPSLSKTIAWTAKAHGPPRETGPLHLLHNVFRI